jgi:arginase
MQVVGMSGAPSSMGGYAPGQELAPAALRNAGIVDRIVAAGIEVHDYGDLPQRRWTPDHVSPRARHVEEVIATLDGVREGVRTALPAGERALVLGGDCTSGLGTIDAVGDAASTPPAVRESPSSRRRSRWTPWSPILGSSR